ncbi:hypothetical protein MYXA107069_01995 [Myxococcus xanthus]|nr:hypothetical protein MyxoNM_12015 [Myxococcus xanthus]SDX02690.1 hypothetical protein SAMN05444383_104627 [Myxococcus xanthus]
MRHLAAVAPWVSGCCNWGPTPHAGASEGETRYPMRFFPC